MNFSQISQLQALRSHLDRFRQNHPKFPMFVDAVCKNALTEGTVIEINVTPPDGKSYVTNLKLTEDDLDFLKSLQQLNKR